MISLSDALPDFSEELRSLLIQEDEAELASQIDDLDIVDRCRCDDDCCATFYTVPRPSGAWGDLLRTFDLPCKAGMVILDVVDERISCVEIIDRPELRRILDAKFP